MAMRAALLAAGIVALTVQPSTAQLSMLCGADGLELSESDASRLDNLFISRTRGLAAALESDSAADRSVVSGLFESGLAQAEEDLLAGTYQCRTIKMGGITPLIVYDWFQCEIVPEEAVYTIRKVTGSQNFFGILQPYGAVYTYKGAATYGYEDELRFYGDDEERNQVGCLSAVTKGNQHFILELPFPQFESFHDVIELRPIN